MLKLFIAVVQRDLQVAFRRWGDLGSPLMFFVIVSSLVPLALSPTQGTLQHIGPAVLWVAALLSALLSLNALYRGDVEDGSMEQLLIRAEPLPVAMLAKTLVHWLVAGVPLALLAPLLGIAYYLSSEAIITLCATLLLGTPTLSLLGSVGAALTAGLRQASGLLALVVLPLMLPVLMVGARATDVAANGDDPSGLLYLLAAFLFMAVSLAPLAAAAAMRITLD